VITKVHDRLEKLAKLASENKISKEWSVEGQGLLERMPKLESQQSLRRKYQQLVDGALSAADFEKARTQILEGTKLKRSEALAFALKVTQAVEIIRQNYFKEEKQEDLVVSAIQGMYQRLDEKIPPDIRARLDHIKDIGEKERTTLLGDVRERFGNREDLGDHRDLDIALEGMTSRLDPYSTYIAPKNTKQSNAETRTRFYGVGVQIRKDVARDMLVVVSPIRGSPAYRARPKNMEIGKSKEGLQAGDIITQITVEVDRDGKPLEKPQVISTRGLSLEDSVGRIMGKAGSKVKLTVEREGFEKPLEFEITRGPVTLETIVGVKRDEDDNWNFALDSKEGIYYIRVISFAQRTFAELQRVMIDLSKKGIKGLVLDLRFNPGGLLGSAVNISDLFIDDGLIVTVRARAGQEEPYIGHHEGSYLNFPLVCLINGGTSDVSEIVAACLQDHKRALIGGERSAGKGTYQNVESFDGGELKLSIASLWRPSGKNLVRLKSSKKDDEWGVMPDKGFLVKLAEKERDDLLDHLYQQQIIPRRDRPAKAKDKEDKAAFKDRQLEKSLEYLRSLVRAATRPAQAK
jgi:C-terminal peptidase prc